MKMIKVLFLKEISLDDNYLFNIKQNVINNSNNTYDFYSYGIIHRNKLPEDLTDFLHFT